MENKITVKEIFNSVQGEGPYVGEKHLFVRTTRCNLNCKYCDTDFKADENSKTLGFDEFFEELKSSNSGVVSFTGGEPLLEVEFLSEFLKKYKNRLNKKIYLETNGTQPDSLGKIIPFVDIISMDIKLKSATGMDLNFGIFDNFLSVAKNRGTFLNTCPNCAPRGNNCADDKNTDVFVKVVFDENISDDEINAVCELVKKYDVLLVLQPKMPIAEGFYPLNIFEKFSQKYKNIRLIPQIHKFLDIK